VKAILSLYDFTGEALKPWAEAGYDCHAFDVQHLGVSGEAYPRGGRQWAGSITYHHADLYERATTDRIIERYRGRVHFVFGFPPCTDLAVSGATHFKRKELENPSFQKRAVYHARMVANLAEAIGARYLVENPVSVLSTKWRKPDYIFQPYEYGGYLPEGDVHPKYPELIMPRDAYPKKTCLWTGGGFVMPEKRPVPVAEGYSLQHRKLGGKSIRTKNIRSATPRGFARAVFEANKIP